MTSKRLLGAEEHQPDFTKLPEPLDPSAVVETHDVDPSPHGPDSPFATPEIEEMIRAGG
jgi:hypothetical protein